jgi:hypothetical protein
MINCSRYRTPWQRPAEAGEPAHADVGSKHYTQELAQSTSRWHGRAFRIGVAAKTFCTVRDDRQHPFGSRATVRAPLETRHSSGPGLCVPALRLVCHFEDEDAAGPSSKVSGNDSPFERVQGETIKLVCQRYQSKKRSFRMANGHPGVTVPPMGNLGRSRLMSNCRGSYGKEIGCTTVGGIDS